MREIYLNKYNSENAIKNIDKIFYINLEHRLDRKKEIIEQIKKIDPELEKTERINAVKNKRGEIGCALSHIKCLEKAIENNFDNVLILEDDFDFVKDISFVNQSINLIFKDYSNFDIFLLSANIIKCKRLNPLVHRALDVQTASGYIINKKFYETLLKNFKYAAKNLQEGGTKEKYSIDITWKELQNEENDFFVLINKLGLQRASYSDIEKGHRNYLV